jgi:hypothetical protein
MPVHGDSLADFGNAVLIISVVALVTVSGCTAFGTLSHRAARNRPLLSVARMANSKRSSLIRVGASHSQDLLLGTLGRERRLGRVKVQALSYGASLLGRRRSLLLFFQLSSHSAVLHALFAERGHVNTAGPLNGVFSLLFKGIMFAQPVINKLGGYASG